MEVHRGGAMPGRNSWPAAPGGKGISKKKPRFGKVAESLQSRLSASFRRRELGVRLSPKSSR
jgi:hypothetical protein